MSNQQQQQQQPSSSSADQNTTLSQRWNQAVGLVESSPAKALVELQAIQKDVAALALFSPNETLQDVSSKSLPLLSLDYYLAMALLGVPTPPGHATERKHNLTRAMELFVSFLARLEQYEVLSKQDAAAYHDLLEQSELDEDNNNNNVRTLPSRDEKIARHRAKQEAQKELQRLQALQSRRSRLNMDHADESDGHDEESLERTLALQLIHLNASQAIEEWHQAKREMPMVDMMLKMEQQRGSMSEEQERPPSKRSNKPLQLTHITQDSTTGQLNIRKEEIRSQVFRPSWNQPTMSLQELADIEVRQAREREAKQAQAEAQQQKQPRRYDQLVQDGLEDDADLVDASAAKDRAWDDFKDANPRGSGNKMGDRGDRNF